VPGRLVLLGHPVAHSLSPVMQNAALEAAGITLSYEALDVAPEDLSQTLDALAAEGAGGNVTFPHKESAARRMTQLSPIATRVGAINTFRTSFSGELIGDNTDVAGFTALARLAIGEIPEGARLAVIGAGGAAAAVLAAVETWKDSRVTVHARRQEASRELVERFKSFASAESLSFDTPLDCHIVVNATTVGLADESLPVPLELLPQSAAVLDLVYRPGETAWVRAARASGRVASDGLPMLVEQGAASFKIWFGMAPDREAMWRAVKEAAGRA
jgi:shikimate dehydrogenase